MHGRANHLRHFLVVLVSLIYLTNSQEPPDNLEIGLRLHSIIVGDDCETIGTPTFFIRSESGDFDVELVGVTEPDTLYTLDLFLFWWPPNLPTITVEVYDDDTGTGDDSLGTVVLERNMMRQYVVYYNTTGGDADCNFQTATLSVYYNETREIPPTTSSSSTSSSTTTSSTTSETETSDDEESEKSFLEKFQTALIVILTILGVLMMCGFILTLRCCCMARAPPDTGVEGDGDGESARNTSNWNCDADCGDCGDCCPGKSDGHGNHDGDCCSCEINCEGFDCCGDCSGGGCDGLGGCDSGC